MIEKIQEQNEALSMENIHGKLFFLDHASALESCCNNLAVYQSLLVSFIDNSKLDLIDQAFKNKNFSSYSIASRFIKKSAVTIGAIDLSVMASQMEKISDSTNYEALMKFHFPFRQKYSQILQQIQKLKLNLYTDLIVHQPDNSLLIVVVDDDELVLRSAQEILSDRFNLKFFSSTVEATSFLSENPANLLLIDLDMAGISGFDFYKSIKQLPMQQTTSVVFLSSDSNYKDIEEEGYRLGAMDFITKPFVPKMLVQRISRLLEFVYLRNHLIKEVKIKTKIANEKSAQLDLLAFQAMQALASTIDAKDRYTNGHSQRVAKYAKLLAQRMGKTEAEQKNIYYVALLHDVGKIGVPDEIINKTSSLTSVEYEIMKTHPIIGANILKNISAMPILVIGARYHHERYDGRGYPDGLRGDEIPEIARIIGVADAYDAMTSRRSYRNVLPQRIVRDEFVKGKGCQFDPHIADLMVELIDEDWGYVMHG